MDWDKFICSLHDFERCDFYFDRAGEYYDEMKPYEKGIYLNNRGNSYYYRQDYKTALKYFRRSLAHAWRILKWSMSVT